MFLAPANVLHYLVAHNFADLESVVNGQFAVRDLSHRNHSFHVTCGSREYLVKQPKKWDRSGRASFDCEAGFYGLVRTHAAFAGLRDLVPEAYGYDPPNSVLILEFLPSQTSLQDAADRFSPHVARLAARVMARVHREMQGPEVAEQISAHMPGVFSMYQQEPEELFDASEGQRELARLIRQRPAFAEALASIRAEWRTRALMHGDWKLANCLVSAGHDRFKMVDWEFVTWGEPLYDAATLLQSYWCLWVQWPERHPIEGIRPALAAFLETYAQESGVSPAEIVVPVVRLAGARMLQSAHEAVQRSESLNAAAVRLAQASLNILTRPEWAAEQLLGARACAAN